MNSCAKSLLRKKYTKLRKELPERLKIQYDHQIIASLAKLIIKAQK